MDTLKISILYLFTVNYKEKYDWVKSSTMHLKTSDTYR